MKRLIYIIILLASAIWLSSCKSLPDSAGKQYPVKESITTASKQEQEQTEVDETLSITLQQFSNRLDTINNKVNALLNQREKVIELSWWDLHKDKIYVIIIFIAIGVFVYIYLK